MIVVKIGGGADIDPDPLLRELAEMDEPWILVHGGNAELTDLQERLATPARFITSPSGHESRYTDHAAMAAIQMSYRGRINNDLVLRLQRLGVSAIGLSGVDGGLLRATRKAAARAVIDGRKVMLHDNLTGTVHSVNTILLRLLLEAGHRPVITLPALADDGEAVNVDGDRAAAAIAAAMDCEGLFILSDVPGLLRDVNDPDSLIRTVPANGVDDVASFAKGRFKKKLMAAQEALDGGVRSVVLARAAAERPLAAARAGEGTVIC